MEQAERRSFWKTLPGILSGIAGLLGATAALLGIFGSLGWLGTSEDEPPQAPSVDKVRLTYQTTVTPRFTIFTQLDARFVPPGSRIAMRCDGPGCFKRVRTRTLREAAPVVSLAQPPIRVRGGAVLEVRYTHPDAGSKIWRLTAARSALPSFDITCAPRDQAPGPC